MKVKKSILVLINIVFILILSMNGCSTHNNLIKTDNKSISSKLTPTEEVIPTQKPTLTQEIIPSQKSISTKEAEQEQKNEYIPSGNIHLLMEGLIRNFMAVLVYEEPKNDDEDYKLLVYKLKDYDENVGVGPFNASLYQNSPADYVLPDMREKNKSIGKFIEIYAWDSGSFVQGQDSFIFVALYEKDEKSYYETRLYKETETGYLIDRENSKKLNEKYSEVDEYPFNAVEEELSNTAK